MYICASYVPKAKADTARVDSTTFNEEIILDENGNPVSKEIPAGENANSGTEKKNSEENSEKKEKKKSHSSEQVINFDDL